jgi:DNA-binding HxlR family transcriptional regulator
MVRRRTYGDRCGIARALDFVGERWALLVVRELLLGPKRFTDLRTGLPNLSPDVLTERLRELEDAGVVARRTLAPPAASRVYELTERGRELEPILLALGRWGSRAAFLAQDARMGTDSTVLALQTLFEPNAAEGFEATVELRLGEDRFGVRVADGELALARGEADDPDAAITSAPGTLASVLWHGRRLDDALRAGDVAIEGSKRTVNRFLTLFPLP